MTVIKKFCDRCGKEVNWLYNVPRILIQGRRIDIREGYDSDGQLCEDCMGELIQVTRAFPKWYGEQILQYLKDDILIENGISIIEPKKTKENENNMSTDRSAIVTKISVMIQEFLEGTLSVSPMSDLFQIPEAPIPDPITAIRNVILSVVTDMLTHAKTCKRYYNEGNLHFRYPKIIAWDNHKNLTATDVPLIFYDEGELYTMEYAEQILQYVFDTLCVLVPDTSATDIDWHDDLKWHRFREKIEDILENACIEAQKEET